MQKDILDEIPRSFKSSHSINKNTEEKTIPFLVSDNWIFSLELIEILEDIPWAIVDRFASIIFFSSFIIVLVFC